MANSREKEFLIEQFRINLEAIDKHCLEFVTFATSRLSQILHAVDDELKNKEQECEVLKEKIMELRKGYDEEDCTTTCPNMQVYERENNNYKQVLEKIKTYCDYIKMFNLVNQTNETNPQKILDIINEVRNEQTNL